MYQYKPPIVTHETLYIEDLVTPIFNPAMAERLATARMKKGWDQAELAEKFGLNQRTLSSIEQGRLATPRHPFSISRMEDVLGPKLAWFVILNRGAASIDVLSIRGRYWNDILKKRTKNRKKSEHWTVQRLREGKPTQGLYKGVHPEVWAEFRKLRKKLIEDLEKNSQTDPLKTKEKRARKKPI